jgi:hypothetical protein
MQARQDILHLHINLGLLGLERLQAQGRAGRGGAGRCSAMSEERTRWGCQTGRRAWSHALLASAAQATRWGEQACMSRCSAVCMLGRAALTEQVEICSCNERRTSASCMRPACTHKWGGEPGAHPLLPPSPPFPRAAATQELPCWLHLGRGSVCVCGGGGRLLATPPHAQVPGHSSCHAGGDGGGVLPSAPRASPSPRSWHTTRLRTPCPRPPAAAWAGRWRACAELRCRLQCCR